ncbi:hypothetical protein NDU88_002782 [Pleurodeles waltl]|uniref:Uncharacterized protein n=1 Tax=Pleurodeles waltl TaxID=8319 RepID=A0AAV7RAZ2_PLEWA|nr:hypothetical protein NDU88_002782 [Pleurodeles waltl]
MGRRSRREKASGEWRTFPNGRRPRQPQNDTGDKPSGVQGTTAGPQPLTSAAPVMTQPPPQPPAAIVPSQFEQDMRRDIGQILARLTKLEQDAAEDC